MKKLLFILILVFSSNITYCQQNLTSIFTNGDRLLLKMGDNSDFFFEHTVKKGHTIYSLSKAYSMSASDIYDYNSLSNGSTLSISQILKIPFKNNQLFKGIDLKGISTGHYIPVYYKTQPKDNIFRISRIYFDQPIDDLVQRNNLSSNNLALGQNLLIGWLYIGGKLPQKIELNNATDENKPEQIIVQSINEIKEEIDNDTKIDIDQIVTIDSLENISSEIPVDFNPTLLGKHTYSKDMKIVNKTEVAFWDKTLQDNGAVFGLHGSAIIDSYINIFNPNLKRSVRVKVIGRIPYGTYKNDVKLVISPRAATQLGGVDRRFKVEISFLEK